MRRSDLRFGIVADVEINASEGGAEANKGLVDFAYLT
jgi:hypothetical protein